MSNRTSPRRKKAAHQHSLAKSVSTLSGFTLQELDDLGGFAEHLVEGTEHDGVAERNTPLAVVLRFPGTRDGVVHP